MDTRRKKAGMDALEIAKRALADLEAEVQRLRARVVELETSAQWRPIEEGIVDVNAGAGYAYAEDRTGRLLINPTPLPTRGGNEIEVVLPDGIRLCRRSETRESGENHPPNAKTAQPRRHVFDLESWIAKHQVPVSGPTSWGNGKKWVFDICPWNSAHTDRSAFVVQLGNGAIAAGCHHNGCQGHDWHDLREMYEDASLSSGQTEAQS